MQLSNVYRSRGMANFEAGFLDAAINDYNEAIRLGLGFGYVGRGRVHAAMGDYEEAVTDYRKHVAIDPAGWFAPPAFAELLSGCPNEQYRDGGMALAIATGVFVLAHAEMTTVTPQHLLEETYPEDLLYLRSTQAAAYAESEDWENAIETQQVGIDAARNSRQSKTVFLLKQIEEMEQRVKRYREKRPWRMGGPKRDEVARAGDSASTDSAAEHGEPSVGNQPRPLSPVVLNTGLAIAEAWDGLGYHDHVMNICDAILIRAPGNEEAQKLRSHAVSLLPEPGGGNVLRKLKK